MPQLDQSQLELHPQQLSTLKALLKQYVPSAEVWAFGSRVRGTSHEGSDLDLVLRNPSDLTKPIQVKMALKNVLQESTLPILLEIHDWAQLPPAFQQNIEEAYVIMQLGEKRTK